MKGRPGWSVAVVVLLVGCGARSPAAIESPVAPAPLSASAPAAADVTITPDRFGQTIVVTVGQTIAFPRPGDWDKWQVDYSSDYLELVSPSDPSRPGADGWRFRAKAAGESELAVTPAASRGGGPAAPPRFAVTIQARN